MNFAPDIRRRSRKPSLTPMIDVVFLLLVFFMLASRFGVDEVLPLPLASGGGRYEGPPRLVDIGAEDIRLNGRTVSLGDLVAGLKGLTSAPGDIIVLRGHAGADLQRVVSVGSALTQAGFARLVLVE